jgi:hypothetical protein
MQAAIKLICIVLLACAAGCNKKEEQDPDPTPVLKADYLKLKPGNYWIYNEYRVNDTSEIDQHIADSVYVEKDTLINGLVFYKLVKPSHWLEPFEWVNYLRDSAGYTVGHTGKIWFSSTDFTTIFHLSHVMAGVDTVARVTTKMSDKDFAVSTPAGIFITTSLTRSYAMFPKFHPDEPVINYNTRYAKDVGMVTETLAIYSINPFERWERRLVRWHVQ